MDIGSKLKNYILLYMDFVLYSLVAVLAKYAAKQDSIYYAAIFLCGELMLLAIYALIWQQVLKRFPLVTAMSNKGITVILGLLWSFLLFGEAITKWNIIGSMIIIAGIWLVSNDG